MLQLLAFEDLDVNLDVLKAYAASGVSTYSEHIVPCYYAAPCWQKVADCVHHAFQQEIPFAHPLPQFPISKEPRLAPSFAEKKEVSAVVSALQCHCNALHSWSGFSGTTHCAACRRLLLISRVFCQPFQTNTRKKCSHPVTVWACSLGAALCTSGIVTAHCCGAVQCIVLM